MQPPLFTVIMTTYNRQDLLPRAIRSALEQTFKDFEILVIDNGSTDGTEEVVRGIKDPRLVYIRNPEPTKSCDAPRNLGIRLAKGSLISFLDDDEVWYPERLKKVSGVFEGDAGIDIVCHNQNIRVYGRISGVWQAGAPSGKVYETLLYEKTCIVAGAAAIRAALLREIGGFVLRKEYDAAADYDLWLRLAERGAKVHFMDEVLGEFSITGRNLSIADTAFGTRLAFLIKEHILKYERKPLLLISRRGMWRLFQIYFIAGKSLIRGRHYIRALFYYSAAALFLMAKPVLIVELLSKIKGSK